MLAFLALNAIITGKYGTHGSLGNEVSELNDFAGVGIDERLEPLMLLVVLHLNDVRQSQRPVLLRYPLESGGVRVVLAGKRALRLRDSLLSRKSRDGLGDGLRSYVTRISTQLVKIIAEGDYSQGAFTKEWPNETTLFSPLKAMLATALATGMPF